jgi:catechol 2,3-dioxygenase-like lactoylglutathione lyase family enzyme
VIHFSIPVSDVAKSTQFYTDVVGCRLLSTTPNGQMVFLDAAVTCLMLVKRDPPSNPVLDDHGGVHHSFVIAHEGYPATLDHLRAHGVEITFEEDRQGSVLNGPRAYFHRCRRQGVGVYRSDELRRGSIVSAGLASRECHASRTNGLIGL